jgi:hypothetical protein
MNAALESTLAGLARHLHRGQEGLQAVRLCAREDRPDADHDDHKVIQDLDDSVVDLLGELDGASVAAAAARRATRTGDFPALVRAVERINRRTLAADRTLRDDMAGRTLPRLRQLTRSWGPDWDAWTGVLDTGLRDVRVAVDAVSRTTVTAWTTIADRPREGQPR